MNQPLSMNLYDQVNQYFEESSDFVKEEFLIHNRKIQLCYFESLVNINESRNSLLLLEPYSNESIDVFDQIFSTFGGAYVKSLDEIAQSLLRGRIGLFSEDGSTILMLNLLHPQISRPISPPLTESVLLSSFDAFTEDINTNISLLRSKITANHLILSTYSIGSFNPRQISLFYIKNKSQKKFINHINSLLEKHKGTEIESIQDLSKMLGLPKYSLVPPFLSTELPSESVRHLMEGRIIIFLDHHPFAMAMPGFVTDLWSMQGDRNYPYIYMITMRMVRILGLFVSLLAPGLYVALVAVNPEVLRIQLALSVALSREGVPYPALVEALFMLGILEMVIEASIRLPKSIGPTTTMVGGIILGQAVVQAKLVSNLLIIILAATTIANFTLVSYQNAYLIRILKYVILLISAVYGLLGTLVGVVWICFYLSSMTTFHYPYVNSSIKSGGSNE
ncbi:spore germination protein [Paenibacillus sp. MCAF9]|uniref:spore germination protein n=1 Tax=Paenibacillus sp. MCAF9 TaxID=3233046 RepID=UPI003F958288